MKHLVFLSLLFLACLAALPSAVSAQIGEPEGPGRKRLEELRKIKMLEALDLTEDQSVKLFAREKDFRKRERALIERRGKIIRHLREMSKNNSPDAEMLHEISTLKELGVEMVNQRYDYIASLRDLLSMKQVAKYIAFEETFMNEVRGMLRNLGRHGGDPDDKR